jgi:predicted amidohydrolase
VPEKGNLKANHERLMAILAEVARTPVDVVVTPECFLDGYVSVGKNVSARRLARYAIVPSRSAYVDRAAEWAAAHSAWLIFGCCRKTPAGVFNSALVFDRRGALRGSYDKVHCQNQDRKFRPGRALPVFDSDFGPFGVMICADRRWPETVRTLALRGARIIFNPTYGMHDELNLAMMRTRSLESEVFIAFTHPEQSLLTGPTGRVIRNETARGRRYSLTRIDLAEADRVRGGVASHLRDRRPDVYAEGLKAEARKRN